MNKKPKNFWKAPPMKKVTPKPSLRLPKPDLKLSKDLVKTGVAAGISLAALGLGVAAYQDLTD